MKDIFQQETTFYKINTVMLFRMVNSGEQAECLLPVDTSGEQVKLHE